MTLVKIKYDAELMKLMSFFESITQAKLKDCVVLGSQLVFVVQPGQIGRAIGKNASSARKLQDSLNRKIKIVEFNPEVAGFVENLILPLKADKVSEASGLVTIKSSDTQTRGILIGRNAQNLRGYESIVKRYFDISEIKVV